MSRTTYIAALMAALTAGHSGCKEDEVTIDDSFDRPLNAAAPIVKAESSAKSLAEKWLSGTEWFADDEGVLMTTTTSTDSADADKVLKLRDLRISINETLTGSSGQLATTVPTSDWNSVEGQRLERIKIKSGTLDIYAKAMNGTRGDATLTLYDKNGEIKDRSGKALGATWSLSDGVRKIIDLSGCDIEPIGTTDGHWHLEARLEAKWQWQYNAETSTVEVHGAFSDIKVSEAYGYFGNHVVMNDINHTRIVAFDRSNFPEGVEFKGAYADINVESTVGAPMEWVMGKMTFTNRDNKKADLDYEPGTVNFPQQSYSDYLATNVLKPQTKEFHIDESNSNIYNVINLHPTKYEYGMSLVANPEGEVAGEKNFITETSGFKTEVKTTLPLWIRVKKLEYTDGVDIDFKDIFDDDNIDYVDSVKIKITVDNGLPLKAYAQGIFCSGSVSVDNMFDGPTLICNTAQLDQSDKVTGTTRTETVKVLTHDDVKKYYSLGVDKLNFNVTVTTEDTGDRFVKIFQHYRITSKVSVEIASSAHDK